MCQRMDRDRRETATDKNPTEPPQELKEAGNGLSYGPRATLQLGVGAPEL